MDVVGQRVDCRDGRRFGSGWSATWARPRTEIELVELLGFMKRATAPADASRERMRRRVLGALNSAASKGVDESHLEQGVEGVVLDSGRCARGDESR